MPNIMQKAVQKVREVFGDKMPWAPLTAPWQVPLEYNTEQYLKVYGQVGWLFGCVSRIGHSVADVKLRLYTGKVGRDGTKEREELHDHPLLDLLDHANPLQTGYEFRMESQFYMDLVGNSFWYVVPNALGTPVQLWNIPPCYMHPVPDAKQFISGWVMDTGTVKVPFGRDEVIWNHYPDPDNPYWGIAPAQSIAIALQTEIYAGKWNRNYFYNDAALGTTIIYPEAINDDEYQRLKSQWRERHQGLSKAHSVAVLSGNARVERATISQRDMDFWRLRKINKEDILGAYGMPLSVMGITENVNRANAESGEYVFARWTVKPRLTLLTGKMTEELAPRFDASLEVGFDDPTPKDRIQLQSETDSGLNAGRLTINEARQKMGDPPIDGADVLLILAGKVPVRLENGKLPKYLPMPTSVLSVSGQVTKGRRNGHRAFLSEEQKDAHWRVWVDKAAKEEREIVSQLRRMFAQQQEEAVVNLTYAGGADQKLLNLDKAKRDYTDAVELPLTRLVKESLHDALELVPPEPHKGILRSISYNDTPQSESGGVWKAGGIPRGEPASGQPQRAGAATRQENDTPEVYRQALRWLKSRIGWAADEIGEETAALLADQLAKGFAEGESMEEIRKRVEAVFDECSRVRALRIARTETIMASNESALMGYEDTGVQRAQFYAGLGDERTCDDCMALHDEIMTIDDSHGVIPVHPNCRCTWLPVVE